MKYPFGILDLAFNQARGGLIKEAQETYNRYVRLESKTTKGNRSQLLEILIETARGFHQGGASVNAKRTLESAWKFLQNQFSLNESIPNKMVFAHRNFMGAAIQLREGEIAQKVFNQITNSIQSQNEEEWKRTVDHERLLIYKFHTELELNLKEAARKTAQLASRLHDTETLEKIPSKWFSTLAYMYLALNDFAVAKKYLKTAQSKRDWLLENIEEYKTSDYRKGEYRFYSAKDKIVLAQYLWKAGFAKEAEDLLSQFVNIMQTTPYDDVIYYQRQIFFAGAEMGKPELIEAQMVTGFDDDPDDCLPVIFRALINSNRINAIENLSTTDHARGILARFQSELGNYQGALKTTMLMSSNLLPNPSSVRAVAFALASVKGVESAKEWARHRKTLGKTYGLLGIMDFLIGSRPSGCRKYSGSWQGHSTLNCYLF